MARKKPLKNNGQTSMFSLSDTKKKRSLSVSKRTTSTSPQPIARPAGKKIWLSATSIESKRRCQRCFWLQVNMKIYQPEGIVSRLANRFDGVIKRYFDLYRESQELPPLVTEHIQGRLESPFQETYFATINEKYGYMGKLDECVIAPDGKYVPVDFKTASSDPTKKELIPAYQFQLDSYAWLLSRNRKPPSTIGHLVYFYPDEGQKLHQGFPMQVTVKTLTTNPTRVPAAINEAIALLEKPFPTPTPECPFCKYVETVKEF